MPHIRHDIGYRSAVDISSPIVQITADKPISDVRYQYQSDTKYNSIYLNKFGLINCIIDDKTLLTHLSALSRITALL